MHPPGQSPLEQLPDELLLPIAENLFQGGLSFMALTFRLLHDPAERSLYRVVRFELLHALVSGTASLD